MTAELKKLLAVDGEIYKDWVNDRFEDLHDTLDEGIYK